jgi:hypothetical protein
VWRLYRFTRDPGRTDPRRDLGDDVRAFANAMLELYAGSHWVAATALSSDGGIDVWFKLEQARTDLAVGANWNRQLGLLGLNSRAIGNRN